MPAYSCIRNNFIPVYIHVYLYNNSPQFVNNRNFPLPFTVAIPFSEQLPTMLISELPLFLLSIQVFCNTTKSTMPTTNKQNNDTAVDDDRKQQQQPPLPPMLQQLLDIHCHLTNQPCLPADHNSLANPLPSCITVHVEPKRYTRSTTQNFYILDSPSRRLQFPTIYLVGNTGNLYTISFSTSGVCCNCPDSTTFCKHVLFILSVSGMMTSSKATFYLNMEFTINQLRTVDLSNNMVDETTNSICCHSINLPCTVCRKTLVGEFVICSKCYGVSHIPCAKLQIRIAEHRRRGDINRSRHSGEKNGPISFPTPILCFLCNRPWMPFTVGFCGKYRNLSAVLKHFQYPLAPPAAQAGSSHDVSSHCFPSTNNNNKNNIHRFQLSTINQSNQFHRRSDLIHSAKRRLTYPSPDRGEPASPITTDNSYNQSPPCPSSPCLDDQRQPPIGKRFREV